MLQEAYRRCRLNGGAPGVDRVTFEQIETQGRQRWLETLQQELRAKQYRPQPLLRVWIPKSNGGQRPLGIPSIRDRVVQMAVVLIIGPIFETDLLPQQYGFRPGVDAKMAVRRIFWHMTQHGRREVVDADLRDYFTSIPHTPLLRSLCRRIADGKVLHLIKNWLTVPVVEYVGRRPVRTTEARRTKRGTPQGSPISPLLANCYFRRFLLAWQQHGHQAQLDAYVINYADDFVICCKLGNAQAAMARMKATCSERSAIFGPRGDLGVGLQAYEMQHWIQPGRAMKTIDPLFESVEPFFVDYMKLLRGASQRTLVS